MTAVAASAPGWPGRGGGIDFGARSCAHGRHFAEEKPLLAEPWAAPRYADTCLCGWEVDEVLGTDRSDGIDRGDRADGPLELASGIVQDIRLMPRTPVTAPGHFHADNIVDHKFCHLTLARVPARSWPGHRCVLLSISAGRRVPGSEDVRTAPWREVGSGLGCVPANIVWAMGRVRL